ncbi:CocE/NonD family hydrolase [Larkinella terrae]|uniref:CocE/NonD family hydrolase n=1 Tax=Larkinella terrae TaxID=2025311 RepID=A0A7K0EFM1_9BACT|nr:CocE/NonD family hydrolase [Larkinella terrae]MRS60256.1 CocE/NonD family hydrolase [Larkinella terrae]
MSQFFVKLLVISLLLGPHHLIAQMAYKVQDHYTKTETYITMRDGVKLFTAIYTPKLATATRPYPILLQRTCYGIDPYGKNNYPNNLGPSMTMMQEGYIMVYQDVRGRYKSEGQFTNMTPVTVHKSDTDMDESSDTFDTIDWLVKHVPNNNGNVGQWGMSYPGFYAAAGLLSNHPALKASSPQAPVSDFFFDDFHHNGAFLESYFLLFPWFGVPKKDTTTFAWYDSPPVNTAKVVRDGYQIYLDQGPLTFADTYYKENVFWQETVNHPNYDDFWRKRAVLQHVQPNLKTAVMTVGGWFDAEDLSGPLNLYKTIEKRSPGTYNTIVMGPFGHGGWAYETGHTLHSNLYFGDSLASFYMNEIEAKFFRHFLKGVGNNTGLPEAYMFDTGLKKWNQFDQWPAARIHKQKLYLNAAGTLDQQPPKKIESVSYPSDPMKPVPHTEDLTSTMNFTPYNYMSEDQRFAGRRPDVLVFQTGTLSEDVTLGGEIKAYLNVASTGTDADFFVKLIDVYPLDEPNHAYMPNKNVTLSNYWQMVRSEMMPARFRNSFEKPQPLRAGQKTAVHFPLQDVLHTFKKGHRIMIQVQSTAFPLFARNPQTFVRNPYKAKASDYAKATQTVFNDSFIEVDLLAGAITEHAQQSVWNFEDYRPSVIGMAPFENGAQSVSTSTSVVTLRFSQKMDTRYYSFGKGPLGLESMARVKKLLGFSEDAKSFSFELDVKPNQRYQLVIGQSFRNENGDRLKPYLIDFKTKE